MSSFGSLSLYIKLKVTEIDVFSEINILFKDILHNLDKDQVLIRTVFFFLLFDAWLANFIPKSSSIVILSK